MTTTVAPAWWARALVFLCLPVAGAGLGAGVRWLIGRVAGWSWVPAQDAVRWVDQLPAGPAATGALALGAAAGLAFAFLVDQESLTVRLGPGEIVLTRPGHRRVVPRADVAVAFRDGDRLVLLGRTGREVAREPSNVSPRRLAAAFTTQGVPWAEQDPYADAYRRWVPGLPDAPDALFTARDKALRGGDTRDADDLREELARLGYVVRDVRRRQYFRQVS